ncbi:hypothetical protein [Syntrophomonas curvata]
MKALQNNTTPSSQTLVSSYRLREGKYYGVYSSVENDAIRDLEAVHKTQQMIQQLKTLMELVEHSLEIMMDAEEKAIINLTYNQKKSWQYICSDLGIQGLEKDVYYRKRKQIIHKMAWCLGLLPDEEADEVLGISPIDAYLEK